MCIRFQYRLLQGFKRHNSTWNTRNNGSKTTAMGTESSQEKTTAYRICRSVFTARKIWLVGSNQKFLMSSSTQEVYRWMKFACEREREKKEWKMHVQESVQNQQFGHLVCFFCKLMLFALMKEIKALNHKEHLLPLYVMNRVMLKSFYCH